MNKNYEEEVFEQNAENEEAVSEKGNKSEKFLRICLGAVIAAVVVIAVLAAVVISMSKSGNEEDTTVPSDVTTTLPVEITTSPAEKYAPGQYTVNVGGNGKLNLRKEPSKDGEQILAIDNATLLTITEVKYDAEAEEDFQYWGKTLYKGWDAWVSMKYLATAYSESIVTPDEVTTDTAQETTSAGETTTLAGESTTAAAETTTASAENTTAAAPETTTAATSEPSTSGPGGVFSTGTYTVTAEPHLNMRENHDVSSLSVAQIPANSTVTIVDVYHDANSANEYTKYWGKTTFGGITGWVAMGYLK